VAKAGGAGNAATLAAALRYHTMGWSLVPLLPGGGKKPDATVLRQVHGSPKWGQLRRRRATEADIRAWFEAKPDIGIGVILGASSGGLVVLDVDKVKAELTRVHEVELKQNAYWMSYILARDQNGEDVASAQAQYEPMIRKLTAAQVQQAAKQFFNMKNYVRVVLVPEGPRPTP
jgi:hypothetical protein